MLGPYWRSKVYDIPPKRTEQTCFNWNASPDVAGVVVTWMTDVADELRSDAYFSTQLQDAWLAGLVRLRACAQEPDFDICGVWKDSGRFRLLGHTWGMLVV